MKVTLTMAISANGMIATPSGNEDFLPHANWIQFVQLVKKVGCFIWGRKTYEEVLKWEGDYLSDLEGARKIVVSHNNIKLEHGFELAKSPKHALEILESEGFEEAIITGGSKLNSSFAKENLIDKVILDVNSTILGEGIPVFSQSQFELRLKLTNVEKITEKIVELTYDVLK
ncbi:dihydrofolate reductase family protein [Candidatus Dojkabacteria bacterium]|nr:dihydrofolate reductase family protein [Candidatus Dojkabacteria bacterium]